MQPRTPPPKAPDKEHRAPRGCAHESLQAYARATGRTITDAYPDWHKAWGEACGLTDADIRALVRAS